MPKDPASVSGQDGVRAVSRALAILAAYRPGDAALTASELMTRVDLSRPTLYRLLDTLERNGFLIAEGDPQRFRLGPAVARLAHVWTASRSLADLARPVMQALRDETGETVALFVPEGKLRLCIAELESPQPLSFKRGVGYRERLDLGASGRVILAHDERSSLAASIDARQLARVRHLGYAVSKDELIEGAVAVAAPFFDSRGVAGSICIFGPSVRLPKAAIERCAGLLKQAAGELSAALGTLAPEAG